MPEEAAVARVRSLIEQNLWRLALEPNGQTEGYSDTTGDLAQKARVSKWHFHRIFKEVTGMTPAEYASQQRALRSDHSTPGDEIWPSNFDLQLTPNFTGTPNSQYEAPTVDIDWEALINDDVMMLPTPEGTSLESPFPLIDGLDYLNVTDGDCLVDNNAALGLPS